MSQTGWRAGGAGETYYGSRGDDSPRGGAGVAPSARRSGRRSAELLQRVAHLAEPPREVPAEVHEQLGCERGVGGGELVDRPARQAVDDAVLGGRGGRGAR